MPILAIDPERPHIVPPGICGQVEWRIHPDRGTEIPDRDGNTIPAKMAIEAKIDNDRGGLFQERRRQLY